MGTEHLLLALLGETEGTAAQVLNSLGITHGQVRAAVVGMMGMGTEPDAPAEKPSFTGRAQDAIDLAQEEASSRGQDAAGTEHILLALVAERDGAAVRILQQLDADPAAIRSALAS